MKNFVQDGNVLTFIAPAGGVVSGDGVVNGALFGIAAYTALAGQEVEANLVGVFALPKAAGALTLGQKVYWDSAAKAVTGTATGNRWIGAVARAAAAGDATVRVRLDGTSI